MRLTTKGRYAVTSMLDLAIHSGDGPVPLADISGRQGISLSYLEQLFAKLRRRGLVSSTRGPGGGYALKLPASQILMSDIIAAVDETVDCAASGPTGDCDPAEQPCLTEDLWSELSDRIYRFLEGISLADLMARADVLEIARRQDRRFCQAGQDSVGDGLLPDIPI
jgi:Rrf2 family iron-sulfur cluster assembly transcriptional regulator